MKTCTFPGRRIAGAGPALVYVAVALVAGVFWLLRPNSMRHDARKAAASTEASARVEKAVTAPAAAAAASVVKIGEANATAPDSPAKDFISAEIPVALANLPAPDAAELIKAEQRRSAVMQGQRDEARRLYSEALGRADQMQRERAAALAERARIDSEYREEAAARAAADRQRNLFMIVAAAAVGLWLYVKVTHLSPGALSSAVNDIRAGVNPVQALDTVTSRLQQWMVRLIAHLKNSAPPAAPPA